MPLNWEPPVCVVCHKRKLIHRLQQDRGVCYPCSRRKTLRVYCDHCSWSGRAPLISPCPRCEAHGRLHLYRSCPSCHIVGGHVVGCTETQIYA